MKKIALAALFVLFSSLNAQAGGNNSLGGLIIGAGGGALVGQAIGRDTQATVIGTAVGSVIGYMIGSDMDRRQPVYRPVHHVNGPPPPVIHERVVERNHYYVPVEQYRKPQPRCREAEILGTVGGKARKIYGTVCRTPNGWELVSEQDRHYNSKWRKSNWKKEHHNGRHYSGPRFNNQHWVGRRF